MMSVNVTLNKLLSYENILKFIKLTNSNLFERTFKTHGISVLGM